MNTVVSRFSKAAKDKGVSYHRIAELVKVQSAVIYDLSVHEEEWFEAISIREIVHISNVLGVSAAWMTAGAEPERYLGKHEFSKLVKEHVSSLEISVDQFETEVGWEVVRVVENPDILMEWSLDCLISLCEKLALDWRSVLPGNGSGT